MTALLTEYIVRIRAIQTELETTASLAAAVANHLTEQVVLESNGAPAQAVLLNQGTRIFHRLDDQGVSRCGQWSRASIASESVSFIEMTESEARAQRRAKLCRSCRKVGFRRGVRAAAEQATRGGAPR